MTARGASVTGLGLVGAWSSAQTAPGTSGCSFGDIAVAPSGAVVQICESPSGGEGPANLLVNIDPDGIGGAGFGAAVIATATNVGGFDYFPAQASRSVDAEAGLAYDRNPASPHYGRLYLMYTEETVNENDDLDVMIRYSDDDGAAWSAASRINDDPSSPIRSQFLPKIATDPASGSLAVCWHDCRNSTSNTAMELFCSSSTPTGAPAFAANFQVSDGASTSNGLGVEFGDYMGLTLTDSVAHPAWADTSNSTGDNPNSTTRFDAYTDLFQVPELIFADDFESGDTLNWSLTVP